ncbi:MAG: LapA family protein [Pseudomonadota bacterium]
MESYIKGFIGLVIVLFFVTFGVKNSHPVRVDYYYNFLDVELPLYGLIFISIVIGVFIGMLMGLQTRLGLKRTNKTLQKENRALSEKAGSVAGSADPAYPGAGEAEA